MAAQFTRAPWRLPRLLRALPALLGYPVGLAGRGELKAALARAAFGGLSRFAIATLAAHYVEQLRARQLFSQALQAIASHRAAGDYLVLMSASPDLYVPTLGQALGFDEVICTRLSWAADRFEGRLASPNCRGEEKLRQLERLRAAHPGLPVAAYGNSRPDLAHLLHCEQGYYVNARGARGKRLAARGLQVVHWA